jgi:biotin carboxyl carrier protein
VHAHRGGTVRSLSVTPGEPVTTGQVICTIEAD